MDLRTYVVRYQGVFLMQWYDPLNKFMLLKHFECSIANLPRVFEMIIRQI